ncbi:hypothetical protein AKO1_009511 [Acrasis kona]|uniref:EGF-like domain-containing protein n=1 Tax=Acrasis kona TaxID=1008807 RepID=A0AAW2ZKU0_9EUKA
MDAKFVLCLAVVVLTLTSPSLSQSCYATDSSCVLRYTLSEGVGQSINDTSPTPINNRGVLNGVTWASDNMPAPGFPNSLYFGGANAWVNISSNTVIDISSSFTVSLWLKTTSASTTIQTVLTIGMPDTTANNFIISCSAANLWSASYSGSKITWATQPTNGIWFHLLATFNSTSSMFQLYVNGAMVSSSSTAAFMPTADTIYFGNFPGTSENYIGFATGLQMFQSAFGATQVANNYLNSASPCSGYGVCTASNTCSCYVGFSGRSCQYWNCSGLSSFSPNVCSGFGSCNVPLSVYGSRASSASPIVSFSNSSASSFFNVIGATFSNQRIDNFYASSTFNNLTAGRYLGSVTGPKLVLNDGEVIKNITINTNAQGQIVYLLFATSSQRNISFLNSSTSYSNIARYFLSNIEYVVNIYGTYVPFNSNYVLGALEVTTSYNPVCTCPPGYTGANCQIWSCYGKLNSDSSVCSSNGTCTDIDTCTCEPGFYGNQCQYWYCRNIPNNQTNVCNNGTCSSPSLYKLYDGVKDTLVPSNNYFNYNATFGAIDSFSFYSGDSNLVYNVMLGQNGLVNSPKYGTTPGGGTTISFYMQPGLETIVRVYTTYAGYVSSLL